MSSKRYPPEFKDEVVRQVLKRGHKVADVVERLGVVIHTLYEWVKAAQPDESDDRCVDLVEARRDVLKLRAQLKRTEEDRAIQKRSRAVHCHRDRIGIFQSNSLKFHSAISDRVDVAIVRCSAFWWAKSSLSSVAYTLLSLLLRCAIPSK